MVSLLDCLVRSDPENRPNQINDIQTLIAHIIANFSKVEVVSYSSKWPNIFNVEAEKIKTALGDNLVEIHHIGSTSVPGLAAKPIIDMIPVVTDIKAVDSCNDAMAQLGYDIKGEFGIPFRRFFKKDGFNIHVYRMGNPEIERHVKFRDWLTKHPHERENYQKLKMKLAEKHAYDIFSYCMGKEEFVSKIDKLSGFSGFRITAAITDTEWIAAKNFRNKYFLTALKFYQAINYIEMPFNDPDTCEGSPDDIAMEKLL